MTALALALRDDFAAASQITMTPVRERVAPNLAKGSAAFAVRRSGWIADAYERLVILQALPVGWDGHSGRRVSTNTAVYSLAVLAALMKPSIPMPSIVPLSYGGLQLEWHRKGWDIEIEIPGPGRVHVFTRQIHSGQEHEFGLLADLNALSAALDNIKD